MKINFKWLGFLVLWVKISKNLIFTWIYSTQPLAMSGNPLRYYMNKHIGQQQNIYYRLSCITDTIGFNLKGVCDNSERLTN